MNIQVGNSQILDERLRKFSSKMSLKSTAQTTCCWINNHNHVQIKEKTVGLVGAVKKRKKKEKNNNKKAKLHLSHTHFEPI